MATRTILLIDYDPVTVEYTRDSLIAAGYTVEVASDGPAGVAAFREHHPDLVLVEAMIPKQHGFEVCKEIKEASEQQTPVVITTSSFAGRKYRTEAQKDYGCDEYLEKPIPQSRLLSVCEELIELAENHALGESAEAESLPADEPTRANYDAAPALDELNEDELIARLDSMLPEDDDSPESEAATFLTFDSSGSEGEMPADSGAGPTAATPRETGLPVALTEDDILSRIDTMLSRPQAETQIPVPPKRPEPEKESILPTKSVVVEATDEATVEVPVEATAEATVEAPAEAPIEAPAEATAGKTRGRAWIGIAAAAILVGGAAGAYFMGWYPGSSPARPAAQNIRPAPEQPKAQYEPKAQHDPLAQYESAVLPKNVAPEPTPALPTPALSEEAAPPAEPEPIAEVREEARKPVEPPQEQKAPEQRKPPVKKAAVEQKADPAPTETIAELPVQEAIQDEVEEVEPARSPVEPIAENAPQDIQPDERSEMIAIDTLPALEVSAPDSEPEAEIVPPAPPKTLPGALIELAETDTAPVPLNRPAPEYDRVSRAMREQGVVRLNLLIDENGEVVEAEVIHGVSPRLDKSATRGASRWRYEPATKDGVPVKTWLPVQVEFKL